MRKVVFAATALLAIALVVILVGPGLVDWNGFRDELSGQLKAATGHDFVIEGDLRLRLVPTPALAAQGVRIANPAGSAVPDLLRMHSIAVEVAIGPLASGRVEVRSVLLDEPELVIERRGSVLRTLGKALASPAADDRRPLAVQFDEVTVRNGTVAFIDAASGRVDRLSGIDATVSARSITGPYRARGRVVAQEVPLDFDLSLGDLASGRGVPLSLTLMLRGGLGRVDVTASLFGAPAANRLVGSIKATTPDLGASVALLTKAADSGLLAGEAQLEATLAATDRGLTLSEARMRWSDISATGALDFPLEAGESGALALAFGRIDLDALLGRAAALAERRRRPPTPAAPFAFAVPGFLPGAFEIKADALVYRGGLIRQARFEGAIADERVNLRQGRVLLPGGSDVSLSGALAARSGVPVFEGQIEASSDNLRAMLEWAGLDLRSVPLARLRRLDGHAALTLRLPWAEAPAAVTLADLDASLDVSRLRGGMAVELRRRLALGIGLSIDKLDLDAYLPVGAALGWPDPAALSLLDTLDANLQLVVGALTYRGTPVAGVKFDGTVQGGTLEVREAGIDQIAGADVHLFGRVTGVANNPALELTLLGHAPDPAAVLKLAGINLPDGLEAASLSARANGGWQRLAFDGELELDRGKLQAKGTASGLDRRLSYEAHVAGGHPSHARLAALLGFPGLGELGPVGLDLSLSGSARRSAVQAALDIGPASLDVEGAFDGLGGAAPAGSFAVSLSHPDLAALARALAPGQAAPGLEGPVKLSGRLLSAPEGITLNGVEGTLGPIKLAGDLEWTGEGPRKRLVAGLTLGETALEGLLAVAALGQPAPQADGRDGGRWTRDPIDLLGLPQVDARVTLAAPAASFGPYRIQDPRATLTLSERGLALEELSARAYSGRLKLAARLDQAAMPRLAVELSLDGADAPALADAARAGAGEGLVGALLELAYPATADLASGRLSATLSVRAEGASVAALAASLAGSARVALTGAALDQVDLCALANGVGAVDGADSLRALLARASEGGGTRLRDAAAEFTLANGVARLPDVALAADCGEITVGGTVDFARWMQDLRAVARLTDAPGFPGVVLRQSGPLDAPVVAVANIEELGKFLAALRPAPPPAPAPPPEPPAAQAAPLPPPPATPAPAPIPAPAAPTVAPRPRAPATPQTPPAAAPTPSPPTLRPPARPPAQPAPALPPATQPAPPPADPFRGVLDDLLRP